MPCAKPNTESRRRSYARPRSSAAALLFTLAACAPPPTVQTSAPPELAPALVPVVSVHMESQTVTTKEVEMSRGEIEISVAELPSVAKVDWATLATRKPVAPTDADTTPMAMALPPGVVDIITDDGVPAGSIDGVRHLAAATVFNPRWAALDESEMATERGAFNGLDFSVIFSGSIQPNSNPTGNLVVNGPPAPAPSLADVNVGNNGDVTIQTVVGNLNGASGIFQITQVPGDFNIVNNNLFVQINVVQDLAAAPGLQSVLSMAP